MEGTKVNQLEQWVYTHQVADEVMDLPEGGWSWGDGQVTLQPVLCGWELTFADIGPAMTDVVVVRGAEEFMLHQLSNYDKFVGVLYGY